MQKTAYELCISDWSSDVCSSDLLEGLVVTVKFIDQQDRRAGTIGLERLEQGTFDEEPFVEDVPFQGPAVVLAGGFRQPDFDHLARVVPLIGRASGRERVCKYV